MTRRIQLCSLACVAFAIGSMAAPRAQGTAPAQGTPGKANWLTDGGDPQKNAWQRNETLITKESVKHMKLAWTVRLDNQPRQMHNLFPPLIVSDVMTAAGPKEIAVVAGISDNLYGIDVATGTQLWKRKFDSTFVEPTGGRGPGVLCPGGLTATPVIGPADAPGKYIAYVISWDGRLRKVDVASGNEIEPAEPFLPPNGKPYALNLRNKVLYTTTAQGCGGNPNAFYSYDLETKKVGQFLPGSGGMWPRSGPTLGKDGTLYAGSGDGDYYPERLIYGQSIIGVKQDPETKAMVMKDWFAPTNAFWLRKRDLDMNVTGPIFDWKGKEYLVQSSKECRLWLLDTAALGGEDHRTPVSRTPLVCNEDVNFAAAGTWGALASWEDTDGTRYVLMPFWGPKHSKFTAPIEHGEVTRGAVAAFKLEEKPAGKPVLTPVWLSRDMDQAEPPVIVDRSVVFAYGSGENTAQADPALGLGFNSAVNRIARSSHATIYALDAHTGKELWSSGDLIKSFNHFSGLSVANGRVYIGTYDGVLYCFAVGAGTTTTAMPADVAASAFGQKASGGASLPAEAGSHASNFNEPVASAFRRKAAAGADDARRVR
jgi:outer membrane protein assembly factor BamB